MTDPERWQPGWITLNTPAREVVRELPVDAEKASCLLDADGWSRSDLCDSERCGVSHNWTLLMNGRVGSRRLLSASITCIAVCGADAKNGKFSRKGSGHGSV